MKLLIALVLAFNTSFAFCLYIPYNSYKSDTPDYFLRTVSIGYFEHFDSNRHSDNFFLSFPLARFGNLKSDPFFIFGENQVKEMGLDFPIDLMEENIFLVPSIFRNVEQNQTGFKINCTIKLR